MSALRKLTPNFNSPELLDLLTFLQSYTHRIYLVGGCVRDLIMEKTVIDYDVEVYDISPAMFDKLMIEWGAVGVGKSFFVYRKGQIDISLPRRESKVAVGHKGFDVSWTDNEREASKRRDFTMNALMFHLLTGELLDYYGGVRDIKDKCLRVVNPYHFMEDSLRVLRAVQFVARFDLSIETETLRLCQSLPLNDLSRERVTHELLKISQGSVKKGIDTLYELKVFDRLFEKKMTSFSCSSDVLRGIAVDAASECSLLSVLVWLLKESYHTNSDTIKEIFAFSRDQKKRLSFQKRIPKVVTDRFLVAMAHRFPLKLWVGGHDRIIKKRAISLGIWDQKIEAIDPHEAIQLGLQNGEIGKFCQQKRRKRLLGYKGKE